jgi:hypothetical protein
MKPTYKGKSAKEWFKLHEVMRRDFGRLLKELQPLRRFKHVGTEPSLTK